MTGNAPAEVRFKTDTLPERDRFPMFCEEVVRRYTGLDLKTQDQRGFQAALELRRVGSIDIGRIATTPVASARTTSLVRDGDDGREHRDRDDERIVPR